MDTIKLTDPENPQLVQESETYLLNRPIYRQFYAQMSKFVLWSHFTDSHSPLGLL